MTPKQLQKQLIKLMSRHRICRKAEQKLSPIIKRLWENYDRAALRFLEELDE